MLCREEAEEFELMLLISTSIGRFSKSSGFYLVFIIQDHTSQHLSGPGAVQHDNMAEKEKKWEKSHKELQEVSHSQNILIRK